MGVLYSSDDQGSVLQVEQLEVFARNRGFTILRQDIRRVDAVAPALKALAGQIDCLFSAESALLNLRMDEILSFSDQHMIPVLSQTPGLSDEGALITLEADPVEQGQLLAASALQVLAGKNPRDLPVLTPKKVSLVINLKVASKFGLKVPFQALSLATRVIR
jgi:putative ABC transport system substrate-binding protein